MTHDDSTTLCEFSASLPRVNTISLIGNNHLECDCRLAWLVCWRIRFC